MRLDLENLPHDTAMLHRLVRDMAAQVSTRDGEIERLRQIVKELQRMRFGRRPERLDPDQLALGLEDLDADIAGLEESQPGPAPSPAGPGPRRKPLSDHLAREDVTLDVPGDTCPDCGGPRHPIGESVSEMLDWVPATLRVLRIRRPKYVCRLCVTIAQAPAPERVIAGGLATPALLAHVLVSKYADHLPLYRQSRIFARHGVELGRSTLAGWVGGACWWLDALHERLARHIFASDYLFADDTPIPVLDPGRGRTKTGRLWAYARDQRGWSGPEPPAAICFYEPDRRAERPRAHLSIYRGILHVDGYAGFEQLTAGGKITLAACWAHKADTGLTGRKIIVDTYGGAAPHGGGAFSGKDPSKVDRSGAYAARWIAKAIVASCLARKATVQLSYAIGLAEPISIVVDTDGTGTVPDEIIADAIGEVFDLSPGGIIEALQLKRPIYTATSSLGHFGAFRDSGMYFWEGTERALALRDAVRMKLAETRVATS